MAETLRELVVALALDSSNFKARGRILCLANQITFMLT